ncbi:MAG: arsenate reductase (azurin) small subunit [Pseudohongiellaceae bacterium]
MSLSRRDFFRLTGAGAATTIATGALAQDVTQGRDGGSDRPDYPVTQIATVADLTVNQPVSFTYPDSRSLCSLLKCGEPVPGGVGPGRDIVAFSILCPHMGCPTSYQPESRRFRCGCHFSLFDPEMGGQQIMGQATQDLPQVTLRWDESSGAIHAVGMTGLIYGRQSNILPEA